MGQRYVPLALALVAGCGEDDDVVGPGAPTAYKIALQEPGHIHAFRQAEMTFRVMTEDGMPVRGLRPTIAYQSPGSDRVSETREGDVVDNGDGTYTWRMSFGDVGAHRLMFRFMRDGAMHSDAFPVEISKAGGERIFCPSSDNPNFAYQVQWEVSPGHIRAGDTATFRIELMRSVGRPMDMQRPWMGMFDHMAPGQFGSEGAMPRVAIGGPGGEQEVAPEYRGMGIYECRYQFGQVGETTMHWLHVTFEDDCGVVDQDGATDEGYRFPVYPPG